MPDQIIQTFPPDAYFAGHFDGEGCVVMIPTHPGERPYLRTIVSGCHLPTLALYKKRFAGSLLRAKRDRPNSTKRCYQWSIHGIDPSERFLTAIYPFLIEKREQVKVALDWLELLRASGKQNRTKQLRDAASVTQQRLRDLRAFSFSLP